MTNDNTPKEIKPLVDASDYSGMHLLSNRWPLAENLRDEFPYMAELLTGCFQASSDGPLFNVYECERVVSRNLIQKRQKKNPTVGLILSGYYQFRTGDNTEILTVLEGELEAWVNDGVPSVLRRDGTIIAPAETTLNMRVRDRDKVFYICRYQPKQSGTLYEFPLPSTGVKS